MPSKKPSPSPSSAKSKTLPPPRKNPLSNQQTLRLQADNRWQRSKRHAWDSR